MKYVYNSVSRSAFANLPVKSGGWTSGKKCKRLSRQEGRCIILVIERDRSFEAATQLLLLLWKSLLACLGGNKDLDRVKRLVRKIEGLPEDSKEVSRTVIAMFFILILTVYCRNTVKSESAGFRYLQVRDSEQISHVQSFRYYHAFPEHTYRPHSGRRCIGTAA